MQHNLSKLSNSVKKYSDDENGFPTGHTGEKRFFILLKASYVDARYDPHFMVAEEDIDALSLK